MELHKAKSLIQSRAVACWEANNSWGFLCMATGTGKSKIFVDKVKQMSIIDPDCVFVVVVPTRKLRDKNWKEEFEKWDALDIWETRVIKTCYKSLNKLKDLNVGILCLDEGHRMTDKQMSFFEQNKIQKCLALTATMPGEKGLTDMNKQMIFRKLNLKTLFHYSLLQALKDKVVADFEIILIKLSLDDKIQYLRKSRFSRDIVSEQEYYNEITSQLLLKELNGSSDSHFLRNERARFIKNLRSKTKIGKTLVDKLKGRFLIFCGSKDQASGVVGHNVYHSTSGDKAFDQFVNFEIDKLGAIGALNEGHSLPMLDGILILQMTSLLRDFIQRLGRAIRYRPNFIAKCYITACENTIDYDWTIKVLKESGLPYKIVTLNYSHVTENNTATAV